jgi:methyl-accepting chemotaxis protein
MTTSRTGMGLSGKLTVLSAAAVAAIVASSSIGFVTAGRMADSNTEGHAFAVALRASATADMNHDALHADVLQSLVPEMSREAVAAAHESALENGQGLKDELTENDAVRLTPEIVASVDGLKADIDAYVALGSRVTEVAKSDRPAALRLLPEFLAQFEKLAVALEANSEVIETAGGAQNDAANDLATTARLVIITVAIVSLFAFAGVARLLVRSAVRGVQAERGQVATASNALGDINRSVGHNVAAVQQKSAALVSGANQVNSNVAALAAAVEEMSASIGEIAESAGEAAVVAGNAVNTVADTTQVVGQLGDSSVEIGKVLDVITSIAEQTNLLALNATIEAARAGDAGKGFAVVANEVKDLAKETANATTEIARRVSAIQNDTGLAVDAIAQIAGVIEKINDFQNTIASAVEEQTATTNEIAGNLGDVSRLTQESLEDIETVAASADEAATTIIEGERITAMLGSASSMTMPPARTPLPRRTLPGASSSLESRSVEVLS